MQYTETQLTKLIEDVEKEFTAHLAKAEETSVTTPKSTESDTTVLAKAEEEKPSKPEEKKDEKPEEKPEAKAKPEGEAPQAEAKPEADQKPAAEAAPQAEAKPEGEAAPAMASSDESCDYDEEDMQHMQKMYSSMSKGELKAHHDVIANLAKCGDMSMNQEKAPMAKSEEIKTEIKTETVTAPIKIEAAAEIKPNEVELLKSELSAEKTKFETLQKNFDAVAAFLTKLVEKKGAPAGKAITNLDVIAKSEGNGEGEKVLSKGEIDSILNKKASDPTLKKSDREAINNYYLSDKDIKGISHLLK